MRAPVAARSGWRRSTARASLPLVSASKYLLDPDSFEEWGMFVEHRCTDFGMAETKDFGRRRRDGLRHHQRPAGLCV